MLVEKAKHTPAPVGKLGKWLYLGTATIIERGWTIRN